MRANPATVSRSILVVIPSLAGGGAERVVSCLTQEWARVHRVTVMVFDASNVAYPHGGTLLDLGLPRSGGRRSVITFLRRVVRLRSWLRRHAPEEAIAFMEHANVPLLLAAWTAGYRGRLTLSLRGNPRHLYPAHRWFAEWFYGFAARVVLNSRDGAARFARRMRFGASRVRVFANPLPIDRIEALAKDGPPPLEGLYFFAMGRLVKGKNFAAMIDVFASAETGNARLVIAGEGPGRAALEARVARLGLNERVRLIGRVENPFPWIRGARAVVMTSRHEGFPNVLLEAFACGRPVVAYDCDYGPREVLRDGVNGFLVPLDDAAAFASRLSRLASDPGLAARMGLEARASASAFEAGEAARRWLDP